MDNEALGFYNVCYSYSDSIEALKNVSFSVGRNESIAICGHNGSGKTTLLKLAAGLIQPKEGSVKLLNEGLNKKNSRLAFQKIGFLFQDSEDQLFCTTVLEDVSYGVKNLHLDQAEGQRRINHALETMKIEHLADRPIHHLSGGEKKRVALAGLIAMEPPILVLDEPTNGLDPEGSHELIHLIHELKDSGKYTIVVITHMIDTIPEFADRIIVMNKGEIHRDDESHKILTDIELLQRVGLDTPEVTHLFYDLQKQGLYPTSEPLPISHAEALKAVAHLRKN